MRAGPSCCERPRRIPPGARCRSSTSWSVPPRSSPFPPVDRLEAGVAVPVVLFQRGTELGGITSQQAEERSWTGLRDPRLSATYTALRLRRPAWSFAGAARLEATLPLGNEAHFAGEPGPVVAPSLLLELRAGPFVAAAESGLRARSEVELGGTVIGTQWASALGAAFDILGERLTVAGEAIVLVGLAGQDHTLPDGGVVDQAVHVPAEWMVSLRTAPFAKLNASAQLGAGGAIPLSHERRREADGDTSERTFAGVTTPAVRVALTLRFVLDTNAPPARAAPASPPPRPPPPPPARPGPARRQVVPFRPPTYYVPR